MTNVIIVVDDQCPPLDVGNGQASYSKPRREGRYDFGTVATITCHDGFEMFGPRVIECTNSPSFSQVGFVWSPSGSTSCERGNESLFSKNKFGEYKLFMEPLILLYWSSDDISSWFHQIHSLHLCFCWYKHDVKVDIGTAMTNQT